MSTKKISCDGADFMKRPFDAGLKEIKSSVANDYADNYQALVATLTSGDPTAGGVLTAEMLSEILAIQGYYLGKEQLRCILGHDFRYFRGIQVQLGLTEHPITGGSTGNVVYLVRGQFATRGKAPADIELPGGTSIDGHFGQLSEVVYLAGKETLIQQPDPATFPNPPYVPPVITTGGE